MAENKKIQTDKRRFEGEWVKLENLISKAKVKRCGSANYPVLSMTMHDGIVEQVNRFKKTIASKDTSSYKIVEPGQLVVGFPIDEGVIYVQGHDFAGIMSPAYNVWDIDRSKIHPAYLELALHSTRSMAYYADKMRGTTARRRSITDGNLLALEIPLPTLQAQNEIVSNLHQVNEIAAASKRRMEVLDDLVKSRFNEMFENMKCNGTVTGVAETFNGDRGKNYPSANDKVSDGLPFVNAGNLKNGSVLFDDMDYITREKYETLSGGKICKGDILYCLRGSLGKSALVDFDEGTVASSLMIIRPNLEVVTSRYLYEALNSPLVIRQMHAADNGSSQPNLSAKSVKAYNIPIPPLALQQEFAEFVAQVDKLRFDVQQQIEKLETLKQSLMQEYFG